MQLISSSVSGHVGALITFSMCLPVRASLGAAINRKSSRHTYVCSIYTFGIANGAPVLAYLRSRKTKRSRRPWRWKYFSHFHAKIHPPPSERRYPHDRHRLSLHVITRPRTSTVQTPTFRNEFIRSSQSIEPTFVLAAVRVDIHIPAIGITAPRRCPPLDHQLLRSPRFLPTLVFPTIPIDGHVFRPPFHLPIV